MGRQSTTRSAGQPEARGDGRDDEKSDDQDEADDLQPDHGDGHDEAHHRDVGAVEVDAISPGMGGVEGRHQHRPAQDQREGQRSARSDGDEQRFGPQHAGGGAQEEILEPRLACRGEGLDHREQTTPKPKKTESTAPMAASSVSRVRAASPLAPREWRGPPRTAEPKKEGPAGSARRRRARPRR